MYKIIVSRRVITRSTHPTLPANFASQAPAASLALSEQGISEESMPFRRLLSTRLYTNKKRTHSYCKKVVKLNLSHLYIPKLIENTMIFSSCL